METNKIYNMDCLEGMKKLPDCSIDCVITDPPYNINKDFENDSLSDVEFKVFHMSWMKEVRRVIKPKHPILIFFNSGENLAHFMNVSTQILTFKKLMVLYKPNDCSMPLSSVLRTSEALLLFTADGSINYESEENTHDVLIANVEVEKGFYHPSVKNIKIIRKLVKSFSNVDDIIIDCFMGSGTTAVACKQLNRRYIGFEINKEYCEIAERRLEQNTLPSSLESFK